jgi:hypothetical protein
VRVASARPPDRARQPSASNDVASRRGSGAAAKVMDTAPGREEERRGISKPPDQRPSAAELPAAGSSATIAPSRSVRTHCSSRGRGTSSTARGKNARGNALGLRNRRYGLKRKPGTASNRGGVAMLRWETTALTPRKSSSGCSR